MPNIGKLYIDVSLLSSMLNFPPDHSIVSLGFEEQNGGYLIVAGPTLPSTNGMDAPVVTLETSFFGGSFSLPGHGPL